VAVTSAVAVIAFQYLPSIEAVKTRVEAAHNDPNIVTSPSCDENQPDGRVQDIRPFSM
jgi:hypothetical protein